MPLGRQAWKIHDSWLGLARGRGVRRDDARSEGSARREPVTLRPLEQRVETLGEALDVRGIEAVGGQDGGALLAEHRAGAAIELGREELGHGQQTS